MRKAFVILTVLLTAPMLSLAGEADLVVPDGIKDSTILYWGFLITVVGMLFGLYQFLKVQICHL